MTQKTMFNLPPLPLNAALLSSKSVEWATPQEVFDALNAEFNFTLDVRPYPMRFQPLHALHKSDYVNRERNWTERELRKMLFVFTNQVYIGKVDYREFEYRPRLEEREQKQRSFAMTETDQCG